MTEYRLETEHYKFKAIHNKTMDDEYENLRIGYVGEEGWCIDFLYSHVDPSIIYMKSVMHYRKCPMEDNLENGIGTKIMLKAALRMAFKIFPKANQVHFHDLTQIEYVERGLSHYVDLPIMKMIQEGVTWYEKHFHAKPVDDWTKAKIRCEKFRKQHPNLTIRDFCFQGPIYWNMISPKKNIMYSEWYIERGANHIPIKLKKKRICTHFVGGYWRGGIILTRSS